MTNYEKIKNMSIDEMASCKSCPINFGNCSFVDFGCWLRSEVEK